MNGLGQTDTNDAMNGSSDVTDGSNLPHVVELETRLVGGSYHLVAAALDQAIGGLLKIEAMIYDPTANQSIAGESIITGMPMFPPGELATCRASKLDCRNHHLPPCEMFEPLRLRQNPDMEQMQQPEEDTSGNGNTNSNGSCELSNECVGQLSAERGENCDNPSSLRLNYANVCSEGIVLIYCIRDVDGDITSGVETVSAMSMGGIGAYSCESSGEYWVGAMTESNYDRCLRGLPTCEEYESR